MTLSARWAWEGLWVGLVRNGWDGFFTLASDESLHTSDEGT